MTLFILDIDFLKKQRINYLVISLFVLAFSLIYEAFSHEVYSKFMLLAFCIPLVLGTGVTSIFIKTKNKFPTRAEVNLYNAGVATLTVGSIFMGVLEIYGTTNLKVYSYLIVGFFLIVLSTVLYIKRKK